MKNNKTNLRQRHQVLCSTPLVSGLEQWAPVYQLSGQ